MAVTVIKYLALYCAMVFAGQVAITFDNISE